MKRFLELLLDHPKGGLALCLCLAVLGAVAGLGLKLVMFPSRPFPVINVQAQLSHTGPEEVELKLTRPMEEAMRGLRGLRKVYAISRPGRAEVTLELHPKTEVSEAAQEVRGRLRRLKPKLPKEARPPVISLYNPAQQPVAVLGVSGGPSLGLAGEWARRELVPELRRLEGVADVVVSGAPEPEVLVDCDPLRLRALGMSVFQVAEVLNLGFQSLPSGHLDAGPWHLPLRTAGRVTTSAQVAELPVAADRDGAITVLGELARVQDSFKDPLEINRLGGEPVVALALHQAWGGDLRGLWRQVEEVIARHHPDRDGYKVAVVYSRAQSLDQALGRLSWMALIAAAAAALALFVFLRRLGSTLVALASLPFSLLLTLLFMRLLGLGLDLMALSGLALAMGILVDNAVVVSEAVHYRWQLGEERIQAVKAGVAEVASPIAFSTLTTVAAFPPLLVVSDQVRLSLSSFFWGMSLSLLASLVAALVLVPLLLARLGPGRRPRPAALAVATRYAALLGRCQRHAWLVILAGGAFLAGCLWLAGGLAFQSGGILTNKGLVVVAVTPPGTPKEATLARLTDLEAQIGALTGVRRVHSRVWSNQGRLTVTLEEGLPSGPLWDQVRALLPPPGSAQFHLLPLGADSGEGGESQTPLTINLFGQTQAGLAAFQAEAQKRLRALPALSELVLKMGSPVPEIELPLNHELLGHYGLDGDTVAREARAHLTGPVAFRLVRGEDEVEVRVRARPLADQGPGALGRVFIPLPGGGLIPLTELVQPRPVTTPGELYREDFKKVVRLTAVLAEADALKAAGLVGAALDGLETPPGYGWELDESLARVAATRREMLTGVGLALILVYLIMVAASESLAGPLLVMTAAPFAAGGAILGLRTLGLPVTMPAYLGGLILAGMLVNTGLVMLDAMERHRRNGLPGRAAARLGAARRLRPILMTTLSTFAGGVPLFLDSGAGSSAWSPLALTLAAGLLVSALFALVINPVLFPLAARLDAWLASGGLASESQHEDRVV